MTYVHTLPDAFPYLVQLSPDRVRECAAYLLDPTRRDSPDGSSFAVTVENPRLWRLWLSPTSYTYLLDEVCVLEGVQVQSSAGWKRGEW